MFCSFESETGDVRSFHINYISNALISCTGDAIGLVWVGANLLPITDNWIVIMQRFDGSVNFNRNWTEYRNGFEDKVRDEYWLGNERVHRMTSNNSSRNESYSLRIEVLLNLDRIA